MKQPITLTLQVVGGVEALENLTSYKLSSEQKELIAFVARTAVQEYVQQESLMRQQRGPQRFNDMDRVMRLHEVCEVTGLCRSSIYRRMGEGTFPKSTSLGSRSVGWRQSHIEAWFKNPNMA